MLPRDILIDILSQFPVKTLVVLSCVCKSWRDTIKDPLFSYMHLTRQRKDISCGSRHQKLVLLRDYTRYESMESTDLIECIEWPYQEIRSFCQNTTEYFRVLNSCNGLILLSTTIISKELQFFILNPSIRTFIPLPRIKCSFPVWYGGLGFDSISKDYKVAMFSTPLQNNVISVYSLKTNLWKNICVNELQWSRGPMVLMNGYLHWIAWSCEGKNNFIVSFDVSREVIARIVCPPTNLNNNPACIKVIFDRLGYVDWLSSDACCIWIMNEYGVAESWTVLCRLTGSIPNPNFPPRFSVLGSLNDEIIITGLGNIFLYDPKRDRVKHDAAIQGSIEPICYTNDFVESLELFGSDNAVRGLDG